MRWTRSWMMLAVCVALAACGDKDDGAEDTGDGDDNTFDSLGDGMCAEYVRGVYACLETSGTDPEIMGLTDDYCDVYDESDPLVQEAFECYLARLAEVDCASSGAMEEIGLVFSDCAG